MSSSFSQWYQEQEAADASPQASGDEEEGLPFFGSMSIDTSQYSYGNLKSSLESQLPQKILGMNYQQRFRMFCALLFLSLVFFILAFGVGIPMIAIRPQKFALSFTLGSLTFMSSFGILKGPMAHFQSMITRERLPFTTIYVSSMMATLYFTFYFGGASGYLLVISSSAIQLLALLWYLISFLPGGTTGLNVVLSAIWKLLQPVIVGCAKLQAICVQKCFSWMTSSSTT